MKKTALATDVPEATRYRVEWVNESDTWMPRWCLCLTFEDEDGAAICTMRLGNSTLGVDPDVVEFAGEILGKAKNGPPLTDRNAPGQ